MTVDGHDEFAPPIAQAFPNSARMRIVGALADAPDHSFRATELAAHAGIGRATLYDHREELSRLGLLEVIENDSVTRYRLADTEAARSVCAFNDALGHRLTGADRAFVDALSDFRT